MTSSFSRWVGKVAVVTGASSGIGAAVSRKLVEAGVKVVGLARRKEKVEELANKLSGNPGKLFAVQADITKEEDIVRAFQWANNNLGPVYILVNNAGVLRPSTLIDGDAEEWKLILDTNVLGLSVATREAVRDMRASNVDGHIVNINSTAGYKVCPGYNMYSPSKYAVTALTEAVRQELLDIGSKIKISSVSPGDVDTDINVANNFPFSAELRVQILKPEDIADAVLYVLGTPPHVQINEMIIRYTGEKF